MATMICPGCGTTNTGEATTCVRCGLDLCDLMATIADKCAAAPLPGGGGARVPAEGGIGGDQSPKPGIESVPTRIDASPPEAPAPTLQGSLPPRFTEGWRIGSRYRVLRHLGEGGMGAVYLVHDSELNRDVALKLIRPSLAGDPRLLERFKREIQLSSEITHPNVLRVYDLGEADDLRFLTMQFVCGEDLAAIIRREGKLPLERLVGIFRQICLGLAAAHDGGVLHRDLKPQNIMVGAGGHVYLMDFGLAKVVDESGMTQTGAVMGTPAYMSPEQVKGETLDIRSDIYSLGTILYEMMTGRRPYAEGSAYEVMMKRLNSPPPPVRDLNPDLPDYLLRILDRCLETDRNLRYGSLHEAIRDLDENRVRATFLYRLRRSRILKPVLAGLLVFLLAGAGFYLYRNNLLTRLRTSQAPPAAEAAAVLGIVQFENRTGTQPWTGTARALPG